LEVSDEGIVCEPNEEVLHPTLDSVLSRRIVTSRQITEELSIKTEDELTVCKNLSFLFSKKPYNSIPKQKLLNQPSHLDNSDRTKA